VQFDKWRRKGTIWGWMSGSNVTHARDKSHNNAVCCVRCPINGTAATGQVKVPEGLHLERRLRMISGDLDRLQRCPKMPQ